MLSDCWFRKIDSPFHRKNRLQSARRRMTVEKQEPASEECFADEDFAILEMERRLDERMAHMSDTFPQYLMYLIREKGMA